MPNSKQKHNSSNSSKDNTSQPSNSNKSSSKSAKTKNPEPKQKTEKEIEQEKRNEQLRNGDENPKNRDERALVKKHLDKMSSSDKARWMAKKMHKFTKELMNKIDPKIRAYYKDSKHASMRSTIPEKADDVKVERAKYWIENPNSEHHPKEGSCAIWCTMGQNPGYKYWDHVPANEIQDEYGIVNENRIRAVSDIAQNPSYFYDWSQTPNRIEGGNIHTNKNRNPQPKEWKNGKWVPM